MTDWVAWHRGYGDRTSPLSRRLGVVVAYLSRALAQAPSPSPSVLSLCAGDARDVLSALAGRPQRTWGRVVLVELDPELAEGARDGARRAGAAFVEVRHADAGRTASFADVLPVDVLVLCGVLGNLDPELVGPLVALLPGLVVPGGHVVWTRGGSAPDRRDEVRRSFLVAGLEELAFEGAPEPFGVGLNRVPDGRAEARRPLPEQLFRFVDPP